MVSPACLECIGARRTGQKAREHHKVDFNILKNAHKYRLHQDLLRWSLLGGYGITFSGIVSLTKNPQPRVSELDTFLMFGGVLLLATLWFLGLAVESWFSNLFGRYAQNCERRMREGMPLAFLFEYLADHGEEVSIFHASYYWALVGVSIANCYFVWSAVFALGMLLGLAWKLLHLLLYATCAVYFISMHLLLLNWRKWVYETFLARMQNLYSRSVRG